MAINTKYLLAAGAAVLVIGAGAFFAFRDKPAPVVTPPPPAVIQAAPAPAAAPVDVCLLPGPAPVPPDGASASLADMELGHDAIQNFVVQLEAYQTCRNHQADHAAAGTPDQQKQIWISQGNDAVDQAHALADAFTAQLKIYQARNPGS